MKYDKSKQTQVRILVDNQDLKSIRIMSWREGKSQHKFLSGIIADEAEAIREQIRREKKNAKGT